MTKLKNKPEIKRIKIDDHIKASNTGNSKIGTRKRGRPRKDSTSINATMSDTAGSPSPSIDHSDSIEKNNDISESHSRILEPVYDTTEEAKAFLRAPFDVIAGLTGIQKLALYPAQLDALAPSFKLVYDKRIAPSMGENADLYAFAICFAGVAFEKVGVYREEMKKRKPIEAVNNVSEQGTPYIPTEHHV